MTRAAGTAQARPRLLLVDDSEAILAFETAVLSGEHTLATARSGREAIARLEGTRPSAVLLDLSMPDGDGEEVLRHMTSRPGLGEIPVVVVSTERQRGEACLRAGAAAFLAKPIRAEELLQVVRRVLADAGRRARMGTRAVLPVAVGALELGVPIDAVVAVVPQVATRPLPRLPPYLDEFFEYQGAPIGVLDLAARLGVEHREPLLERKLVLLSLEGAPLALGVDQVRDPRELAPGESCPMVNLDGLLSRGMLRRLPELLRRAHEETA